MPEPSPRRLQRGLSRLLLVLCVGWAVFWTLVALAGGGDVLFFLAIGCVPTVVYYLGRWLIDGFLA